MKYFPVVLGFISALVFGTSVQSEEVTEPIMPESGWLVSLGTGGGITGGGSSTIILENGDVLMKKRARANSTPEVKKIGIARINMLTALHRAMNMKSLVNLKHREYANMSTSLTWSHQGTSRTYVWEIGSPDLPQPLHNAVMAFRQAVDLAQKDAKK